MAPHLRRGARSTSGQVNLRGRSTRLNPRPPAACLRRRRRAVLHRPDVVCAYAPPQLARAATFLAVEEQVAAGIAAGPDTSLAAADDTISEVGGDRCAITYSQCAIAQSVRPSPVFLSDRDPVMSYSVISSLFVTDVVSDSEEPT